MDIEKLQKKEEDMGLLIKELSSEQNRKIKRYFGSKEDSESNKTIEHYIRYKSADLGKLRLLLGANGEVIAEAIGDKGEIITTF